MTDPQAFAGSFRLLAAATVSSGVILAAYSVLTTSTLGTSSAIFAAIGLVLLERAVGGIEDEESNGTYSSISVTGVQPGRSAVSGPPKEQQLAALRDFATVMATVCGLTLILVEPSIVGAILRGPLTKKHDQSWPAYDFMMMQRIFWMLPVTILSNALMYIIVSGLSLHYFTTLRIHTPRVFSRPLADIKLQLSWHGAVHISLLSVFACICAKLNFLSSFSNVWFSIVFGASAILYKFSASSSTAFVEKRSSTRVAKRVVFDVSALSIGLLLF